LKTLGNEDISEIKNHSIAQTKNILQNLEFPVFRTSESKVIKNIKLASA